MMNRSHRFTKITNMIDDLQGYSSPVYYNSEGISNMLSLSNVINIHRVAYDSEGRNTFTIHKEQGDIIF